MNARKIRFAVRLCTGGLLGSTRPVGAAQEENRPKMKEVK